MQIIWITIFYLYSIFGYFWFSSRPAARHLVTPWESLVPTVPIFLLPYFLATITFLAIPIIFYLKLGWEKTRAYLATQALATGIGYLVYATFPTSVVRAQIEGEGFFYNWLRWLHANDRPSAAFPSGHVYHTTVISFFLWIYYPKTRPFVAVILPLVIASTVLLKQHYLPDIVGGLVTATFSILIYRWLSRKIPTLSLE